MRYTRQAALAALALLGVAACTTTGSTTAPSAEEAKPTPRAANVPATEEERQREIERRAALRGQRTVSPAGVDSPGASPEAMHAVGEVPDAMLALMKADLAARVGKSVDAAQVMRAEQVVWPDGSIGCAVPGGIYTQATVVGYLVEFEFEGRNYRYHSALNGAPIFCERPGPHAGSLGPEK
jgi:hypothetical protein